MKLLVLSDVHGNLAALEAVLAAEPVFDRVVFCGDAVDYGPDPAACVEKLEQLGALKVRGNHDNAAAFGIECGCSTAFLELSRASRRHTRAILTPADRAALGSLPTEARFAFGGLPFYLTHATPRDNLFEYVSPDKDPERWAEAMNATEPGGGGTDPGGPGEFGAIIVGHTHRPYLRTLGRVTVVNPGSVGQPRDGEPRAAYATWVDGRFELKRAEYDVQLTRRRLAATGLPPGVVETLGRILEAGGGSPR